MKINKWYFCINEKGFRGSLDLIKVAVGSARKNTDLVPVCIYNGGNVEHIDQLSALGAKVIRHNSVFESDLKVGYGEKFDVFSGHWLRVDIPIIEEEEEFVLYTDNDVFFKEAPLDNVTPDVLAAAPEFDLQNLDYFSSGVMVLNVPNLRKTHGAFVDSIVKRLHGEFKYPAHDQESFNRFFSGQHTRLDPVMNWKPFWGINEDARIIHFHGPKPFHARKLAMGEGDRFMPAYQKLWSQSPEAYEHYSNLYEQFR
jgi:hypothetical protein